MKKKAAQFLCVMFWAGLATVIVMAILKFTGHNVPAYRWWDALAIPLIFSAAAMTVKELGTAKEEGVVVAVSTTIFLGLVGFCWVFFDAGYQLTINVIAIAYLLTGAATLICIWIFHPTKKRFVLIEDGACWLALILWMMWLGFLFWQCLDKGIATLSGGCFLINATTAAFMAFIVLMGSWFILEMLWRLAKFFIKVIVRLHQIAAGKEGKNKKV
ncbi:MAG: hypothetical protein Q8L57_02950 [bacterium]|nr:hypothetical protein [bacterium]